MVHVAVSALVDMIISGQVCTGLVPVRLYALMPACAPVLQL
jgi:hypothetical protein